jgi:predicted GIY-YIG superfamily endonuclease
MIPLPAKEKGKGWIYYLKHPDKPGARYVGQTVNPKRRWWQHCHRIKGKDRSKRAKWIRGLRAECRLPEMVIIEECGQREMDGREWFWIEFHARIGTEELLNG